MSWVKLGFHFQLRIWYLFPTMLVSTAQDYQKRKRQASKQVIVHFSNSWFAGQQSSCKLPLCLSGLELFGLRGATSSFYLRCYLKCHELLQSTLGRQVSVLARLFHLEFLELKSRSKQGANGALILAEHDAPERCLKSRPRASPPFSSMQIQAPLLVTNVLQVLLGCTQAHSLDGLAEASKDICIQDLLPRNTRRTQASNPNFFLNRSISKLARHHKEEGRQSKVKGEGQNVIRCWTGGDLCCLVSVLVVPANKTIKINLKQ